MNKKYMIVRFFSKEGKASKIIQKGLSLEEAQEHCKREDTHKAGIWFDGYTEQDSLR